jgi:SWI/SNF-related matrix-associated actin-dependent regulator 1 of chromatin subfamily A
MITITQEGGRYVARFAFDYATKDLVKAAGFRFDGVRKIWWTDKAEIAAQVSADPGELAARLNAERQAQHQAREASIVASHATDAAIEIPVPQGLEYLPYQKAGIAYALRVFGDL